MGKKTLTIEATDTPELQAGVPDADSMTGEPADEAAAVNMEGAPPLPQEAGMPEGGCAAGFYCYIGPSITGLVQHGAIYRGTRQDALSAAAAAIEKYPLVKTLIVSGDKLPEARLKVKKPGNALYKNYQRILGKA